MPLFNQPSQQRYKAVLSAHRTAVAQRYEKWQDLAESKGLDRSFGLNQPVSSKLKLALLVLSAGAASVGAMDAVQASDFQAEQAVNQVIQDDPGFSSEMDHLLFAIDQGQSFDEQQALEGAKQLLQQFVDAPSAESFYQLELMAMNPGLEASAANYLFEKLDAMNSNLAEHLTQVLLANPALDTELLKDWVHDIAHSQNKTLTSSDLLGAQAALFNPQVMADRELMNTLIYKVEDAAYGHDFIDLKAAPDESLSDLYALAKQVAQNGYQLREHGLSYFDTSPLNPSSSMSLFAEFKASASPDLDQATAPAFNFDQAFYMLQSSESQGSQQALNSLVHLAGQGDLTQDQASTLIGELMLQSDTAYKPVQEALFSNPNESVKNALNENVEIILGVADSGAINLQQLEFIADYALHSGETRTHEMTSQLRDLANIAQQSLDGQGDFVIQVFDASDAEQAHASIQSAISTLQTGLQKDALASTAAATSFKTQLEI